MFLTFRSSCAIAEEDTKTVVITGGSAGGVLKNAIRYGLEGWIENLEPLNRARKNHGCTSYISSGERVTFD